MFSRAPLSRTARLLVLGVVATGLMPALAAEAQTPPLPCGAVITQNVTLQQDLFCPSSNAAFTIGAPGVTVDLGGHKVTGPVEVATSSAALQNGVVTPFVRVSNPSTGAANDNRLTNLRIATSSPAADQGVVAIVGGSRNIVEQVSGQKLIIVGNTNTIRSSTLASSACSTFPCSFVQGNGNVLTGLRVTGGMIQLTYGVFGTSGDNNQLVSSTLSKTRVELHGTSRFEGNLVSASSIVVPHWSSARNAVSVKNNWVLGSPGAGLLVAPTFSAGNGVTGEISGNIFANGKGAGIEIGNHLQELGALRVTGNVVTNNAGDGISVNGIAAPGTSLVGGPVTLAGNTATNNGGNGIDARWIAGRPSGVVDGGGNRASGNRTQPQCLGVICR